MHALSLQVSAIVIGAIDIMALDGATLGLAQTAAFI